MTTLFVQAVGITTLAVIAVCLVGLCFEAMKDGFSHGDRLREMEARIRSLESKTDEVTR